MPPQVQDHSGSKRFESTAGSADFCANDRTYDSFELSESLGTQFSGLQIQNPYQPTP